MKKITFFILYVIVIACFSDNNPSDRYIKFLRQDHFSAKDYLIDQLKTHDMIVLCERDHYELTQYQLIVDVMKTSFFIDSVGTIYTEVGSVNRTEQIERFLRTDFNSDSIKRKELIKLFRDIQWPAWEKYNYYYLLYETNKINSSLPYDKHIMIRPVGEPTPFKVKDGKGLFAYNESCCIMERDSTMAIEIISQFDQLIHNKRAKCLVIMNYRHAFSKNMINDKEFDTLLVVNTGALLSERYQDKVSFIMINNLGTTLVKVDSTLPHELMQYESTPIQKGLWDYSFQRLSIHDMGFDFSGSPFGDDPFDFWSASDNSYTYKDIFNGFIYYLPLDQHILASGAPDYLSDGYEEELLSRFNIINEVMGTNFTDSYLIDLFTFKTYSYKDIDRYNETISNYKKYLLPTRR